MLKHGRAGEDQLFFLDQEFRPQLRSQDIDRCRCFSGVPMEVMGLMLGEFIDATTVSLPAISPILHSAHPSCTTDSFADLICCLSSSISLDLLRRRLRHAPIWNLGHGRIRGSRLSDQDARHAQTDGKTRDGRRMVPFPPWIRMLVE